MTLPELKFEIQKGDIINYYYIIERIRSIVIETENINTGEEVKFSVDKLGDKYAKIMVVSRDEKIYFKRNGHGGYTHGKRKAEANYG